MSDNRRPYLLSEPCPTCRARPGLRCRTKGGDKYHESQVHAARYELVMAARRNQEADRA